MGSARPDLNCEFSVQVCEFETRVLREVIAPAPWGIRGEPVCCADETDKPFSPVARFELCARPWSGKRVYLTAARTPSTIAISAALSSRPVAAGQAAFWTMINRSLGKVMIACPKMPMAE